MLFYPRDFLMNFTFTYISYSIFCFCVGPLIFFVSHQMSSHTLLLNKSIVLELIEINVEAEIINSSGTQRSPFLSIIGLSGICSDAVVGEIGGRHQRCMLPGRRLTIAGSIEGPAIEGSQRPRADVHPADAEFVPQLHRNKEKQRANY
jgi:hypothetical protein